VKYQTRSIRAMLVLYPPLQFSIRTKLRDVWGTRQCPLRAAKDGPASTSLSGHDNVYRDV
jgi:hypothetical protein